MLRRRLITPLIGVTVLGGLVVPATVASATSASAPMVARAADPCQSPACCPDSDPNCYIHDDDPGTPGTPGNPSGPRQCTWNGQVVPCTDRTLGEYIGNGCYAKDSWIQQPPPEGKTTEDGRWTVRSCYADSSLQFVFQLYWWRPYGKNGPDPETLAREARAGIRLEGAAVGFAPNPGGSGLVGLPVWMWTEVTANTWGPITASATDGGLTVTITATAQKIDWNMGNADTVTCANPGTKYEPSYGRSASPTCGYTYRTASRNQPDGRYAVTATTTWRVDWAGGGETGVITTTRVSNTTVRIEELQVVVG